MEPEVLIGVSADDLLEGRGVALGEEPGVVGGPGPLVGLEQLGAADLVAEAGADPTGVAHHDGGLMLDGHQGDGLVGRGGPAEEVDEHPALAGVLVGQEGEDPAGPEDSEHLVVAPLLGDHLLPGPLAEGSEEAVEVRVVEGPGHRVGREPEDAEQVSRHLPVAEVSGQHDQRPALQEPIDHLLVPDERDPVAPGGRVELAGDVEDLHQHPAEMEIDPPDDPVAFAFGVPVAERLPEVLESDLTVPLVDLVQDPGQGPREGVRLLDAHRLGEADDQADEQVNGVVRQLVGSTLQRPLLRPTGRRCFGSWGDAIPDRPKGQLEEFKRCRVVSSAARPNFRPAERIGGPRCARHHPTFSLDRHVVC